ncbi:MAG: TraR/DksA C4-type zinc finger protein [Actinomycetota bacterium]
MKEDPIRKRLSAARDRLLSLRASLLGQEAIAATGALEPSGNEEHPADIASETFERSKDLSILLGVEAGLADVEHAASRLASGTYGICEACGEPINPGRLEVLPAARYCTKDQARMERESSFAGSPRRSGYGYLALAD